MERIGGEQQATARIVGDEVEGDLLGWAGGAECECPEFCRIDHDND